MLDMDTSFEHCRKHPLRAKFRFGQIRFPHSFLHTGDTGCSFFNQVHTGE